MDPINFQRVALWLSAHPVAMVGIALGGIMALIALTAYVLIVETMRNPGCAAPIMPAGAAPDPAMVDRTCWHCGFDMPCDDTESEVVFCLNCGATLTDYRGQRNGR